MTIEVPAAEVYALAAALSGQAGEADEIALRLGDCAAVGGPVQPAIDGFLACHRTAAVAVAGELRWLGGTVAAVADSWLGLDGSLLAPPGEVTRR
jgi:hypothetical protein